MRLIVERERQRMAFVSATYWDLLGTFAKPSGRAASRPTLVSVDGRKIPTGSDFDSGTGKLKDPALLLLDEAAGRASWPSGCAQGECRVASVEDKPYTTRPYPPFTTSTLQQEANRKLRLHRPAHDAGGPEPVRERPHHLHAYRLDQPGHRGGRGRPRPGRLAVRRRVPARRSRGSIRPKVKNAQEAHEAIRPAGHPFDLPEALRGRADRRRVQALRPDLEADRSPARWPTPAATGSRSPSKATGAVFQVSGKTIDFPGYLRAYVEGSDDPEAELADQETVLPAVARGRAARRAANWSRRATPRSRRTATAKPSLTRTLEENGIGRPSTYASIIDTILARSTSSRRATPWCPPGSPSPSSQLLEEHLPDLVDYQFTAQMEDELDAISRGEMGHVDYLKAFYFGNEHAGPEAAAGEQGRRDRRPRRQPDLDRQARGRAARRSSSAWAATGRSSSRASAGPACPRTCRPTN